MRVTAHLRAWLESAQNQLSGCAILMAWNGLGGSKLYSFFSMVTQQWN
jgi:predicted ATPase